MLANIRRVHDPSKDKDVKKDTRKVEEFSVGGAQSTTAVLRPVRDRDDGDIMKDLVLNAKNTPQEEAEQAPSAGLTITVYRNGFIVGDGPFRDISVPTNRLILEKLHSGEVPPQLEKEISGDASTADKVKVDLVNHSTETYVVPTEPFSFDRSQGFSLSDRAPQRSAASPSLLSSAEFSHDPSQPTATVMLQLSNGQRSRLVVNMSTTVAQIYQHVRHLSQIEDGTSFTLTGGFPPRELVNPDDTVEGLKLKGCSITQKIV